MIKRTFREKGMFISVSIMAFSVFFYSSDYFNFLKTNYNGNPEIFYLYQMILPSIGFILLSYFYLLPENNNQENKININGDLINNTNDDSINNINNEIQNIKEQLTLYNKDKGISEEDKKEILDGAMKLLSEDSIKGIFKDETSLLEIKIEEEFKKKNLKNSFNSIIDRLKREIREINKRSMYNLLIGVSITILGIGILSNTIFSLQNKTVDKSLNKKIEKVKDETKITRTPTRSNAISRQKTEEESKIVDKEFTKNDLIKLIPTFSLVLFIELFAYFFLRLYREGLTEMKYFRNELTNIESKLLAVDIALMKDYKEFLKSALDILLLTERNFVMKKGETTVELEKAKSESENMQNIMKAIPSLFKREGK